MRVKRPVDFQMAPKKAVKGKSAAAEPTLEEGWNISKCSQYDLDSLVLQGLLVPKSVIQWRPALGSDHPYENTGEIVAFTSYLDPIASSDPKFLCSYFHLCAFMRSFFGHQAPF